MGQMIPPINGPTVSRSRPPAEEVPTPRKQGVSGWTAMLAFVGAIACLAWSYVLMAFVMLLIGLVAYSIEYLIIRLGKHAE
jgi:hypothetical protein